MQKVKSIFSDSTRKACEFVPINPKNAVSQHGLVKHLQSGHGVRAGMLIKPKLMKGKIYYRLCTPDGAKWTDINDVLNLVFGIRLQNCENIFPKIIHCVDCHNQKIKEKCACRKEFDKHIKDLDAKREVRRLALQIEMSDAFPEEDIYVGY